MVNPTDIAGERKKSNKTKQKKNPCCVQDLVCPPCPRPAVSGLLCAMSAVSQVRCVSHPPCPMPAVSQVRCVYPMTVSQVRCVSIRHVPCLLCPRSAVYQVQCVSSPPCPMSHACCVQDPLCTRSSVSQVRRVPVLLCSRSAVSGLAVSQACCVPLPLCLESAGSFVPKVVAHHIEITPAPKARSDSCSPFDACILRFSFFLFRF